jgi:lysozyme
VSRFDESTLARAMRAVAAAAKRPQAFADTQPHPQDIIDRALIVAISLVERFEGVILTPYLCPAGVPTIGLGTTRYPDGTAVTLADPAITRERAYEIARHQLQHEFLPHVLRLCPGLAKETAGRLGAILDFTYNLGWPALAGSTLRKRVNAGDWGAVKVELSKWVNGGGRRLRGLVLRRAAEAALV